MDRPDHTGTDLETYTHLAKVCYIRLICVHLKIYKFYILICFQYLNIKIIFTRRRYVEYWRLHIHNPFSFYHVTEKIPHCVMLGEHFAMAYSIQYM